MSLLWSLLGLFGLWCLVFNELWGTLNPPWVSGGGAGWSLVVVLTDLWTWGPVLSCC